MRQAQLHAHQEAPGDARVVGWWLVSFALMVLAIIVVGGATRLTESGLSITEWKPVSGVLPPLTHAQWVAEFDKYRQIPQYERLNAGMTLGEFRGIYLWEYAHRLVARLIGLAFALPLAWFVVRRRLPAVARRRTWLLLALMGAQGAMGWYMVKSGLSVRTEVSQYRLAAHLMVAFVILAITVWTAADLLAGPRRDGGVAARRAGRGLLALLALVFLTSFSGALVAGLRAGKIYNTFPLMGGRVVPAGYGQLSPAWLNVFENHAAVQFNHRLLAVTTFLAAMATWLVLRGSANRRLAAASRMVAGVAMLQLALGVATLLLAVPIALGVAHQLTAALLVSAVVLAWHASGASGATADVGAMADTPARSPLVPAAAT